MDTSPNGIKVWLDDERPMPDGYTHHCKTAEEAIDLISQDIVSEISLDHDLGEGRKTGYDVACFIEIQTQLGNLGYIRCRIHSQNPVGAANMKKAIQNVYKYWMAQS